MSPPHIVQQRHQARAPTTDVAGEEGRLHSDFAIVDTVVVLGDAEGPEDRAFSAA